MKIIRCDCCSKIITMAENYDENGYSKFVNIAVRDSRTYQAEYDICNECFQKMLNFATGCLKETKDGAKEG